MIVGEEVAAHILKQAVIGHRVLLVLMLHGIQEEGN